MRQWQTLRFYFEGIIVFHARIESQWVQLLGNISCDVLILSYHLLVQVHSREYANTLGHPPLAKKFQMDPH